MSNREITPKNRTWIEISKRAIDHNITQYKKIIKNKILAPVIKGNAYGHGIIEVAHICQQNKNIEWLCTTSLQEALLLRKNSISKKILVLFYTDGFFGEMVQQAVLQNISLIVYDIATIKDLNALGQIVNKKINIHIKIDTGLSRFGILADQAIEFIKQIKIFKFIYIEGICTHFAESPSTDRTFTNLQATTFNNLIKKIKNLGIQIPFIHTSNSAGTTTVEIEDNNLFRVGIGIYGYWPSDYVKNITQAFCPDFTLKPVLTWKSKISSIRTIQAGSFVGYNRTHLLKNNTKLAIIPVGYYDGYERRLSNKGCVIIHGQIAPIIGLVCMNVFMVDISNIKNTHIGDEVILMGEISGVRANECADLVDTNLRELTTKINPEIPRLIVD